jgi:SAM-dependent MidA family methyltransferase
MQIKGLNIDEDPMNASSVALYLEPLKNFSSLLIEVSDMGSNESFDAFCVDSFQKNKENVMENSVLLYGNINEAETCYFDVVNKYKTPTSISVTENPTRLIFAMRGDHLYVFIFPLKKTAVISEILLKFEWIE